MTKRSLAIRIGGRTALGVIVAGAFALVWPELRIGRDHAAGSLRSLAPMDATDSLVPAPVERVICSGAGSLRLLTYLQGQDRIVAVDSIEVRDSPLDARPYAIANPSFRQYPVFGEFRGWDNP